MTQLIAYHAKTADLALFESNGQYWIGSYFSQASHQNGEPPYVLIEGYFSSEQEGRDRLEQLRGDEF
jgi:hypothetical protein